MGGKERKWYQRGETGRSVRPIEILIVLYPKLQGPPAVAGSGVNAVMGLGSKSPRGGLDSAELNRDGNKLNLDVSTQQYLLQRRKL